MRVLVGNLALKMPAAPRAGAGVHPTTAPCYCRIRLDKLPYQTATAPLLPSAEEGPASCTGAFAAAFHVSKADLDRATTKPALFGPRCTCKFSCRSNSDLRSRYPPAPHRLIACIIRARQMRQISDRWNPWPPQVGAL